MAVFKTRGDTVWKYNIPLQLTKTVERTWLTYQWDSFLAGKGEVFAFAIKRYVLITLYSQMWQNYPKNLFFYLQHNPITTVSVNETIMRSLTQETDGKRYCCPGPWPLHSMKLLEKPHTALLFNCHCLIQFRAHRGIWKKKIIKIKSNPAERLQSSGMAEMLNVFLSMR